MNLRALQSQFQQGVLGASKAPEILTALKQPPRIDAHEAFAVYRDGYRLRLAEFLSHDYPALRRFLGDAAFGALVEAYIEDKPSPYRNARWYGSNLPDFIQERAIDEVRDWSLACAFADFERALIWLSTAPTRRRWRLPH